VNDLLDDRLRTMMRTATTDAPEAPTVDDLQAITVVGAEPRQRSLRPIAAAAAVVALVGTGALAWWSTGDDGQVPADEPDTSEDAVIPGAYLDAYYLPTDLPEGWQIVEGIRHPAQQAYTGNSAVFANRDDSSVRGVASFAAGPDASPATTAAEVDGETTDPLPTDAASARWDPENGWLSWTVNGREATLVTTNRVEMEARQLAEALVVVQSTTGPTFDVRQGSGWVEVKEYQLDGGPIWWAGNSLTIGRDEFTAVTIYVTRAVGAETSEWARPSGTAGVFVVETPGGGVTLSRSVDGLTLEAYLTSPAPDVLAQFTHLLASMREVTRAEWDAALPDITATLIDTPVAASFDLLDHLVTLRRGGPFSGICVERGDGAIGCARFSLDATTQLPVGFATNVVFDDGSWAAVGAIESTAEMCDVTATSDALVATAVNGGQQIVLFLPGPETQAGFSCNLGGESEFGLFFVSELQPGP
jgi:hypothetical protein